MPSCLIEVRVTPRSSRNKIEVGASGEVKVWTTAPPTDGQANAAVCEVMAKALGIPKSSVAVVGGQTSRSKKLSVDGLSAEDASRKLTSTE